MHLTPGDTGAPQSKTTGNALDSRLPSFKQTSRDNLHRLLNRPGFSGQIPEAQVNALLAAEQKSIDAVMVGLLPLARTYSRPRSLTIKLAQWYAA